MGKPLKLLLEDGVDTLCYAIRGTSDKATAAATAVVALADATSNSLGEVEKILNDMSPEFVIAAIPTTGWVDNTDNESKTAGYTKMYSLEVKTATSDDGVEVTVLPAGEAAAIACGICPTADVVDGAINFYAVVEPAAAIAIQYTLKKG